MLHNRAGRLPVLLKAIAVMVGLCTGTACMQVNAQKQQVTFQHLDIDAGLSQNNILCILQDSKGFMWFGTRDGLNKYDGYHFTVYKNDVNNKYSISNNFISAIAEDANGIIWISTRGGGLNRYDRNKDQFKSYQYNPATTNSVGSDLIDAMIKDSHGNLWLCTENAGVDYFEPATGNFKHYRHDTKNTNSLTDDNTRSVYEDSDGNIWIGGHNGLNFLDRKTNVFKRYQHNTADENSVSNNYIRTIFEDCRHRLWIGTDGGGLDMLDRSAGAFKHFVNDAKNSNSIGANVVFGILEDADGNIWIGTENGGLSVLDPNNNTFYNYKHDEIDNKSISHNSIYSLYRDHDNNIWVGTYAGGVNIYSKAANRFSQYKATSATNSLSNNNVLCLTESANGKIWIGTDGGGLNLFDPVTKNFKSYRHAAENSNSICGDYVLTVCEDHAGNIWMSSWSNGITLFNPIKNTYRHFTHNPSDSGSISSNSIWSIIEDSEHHIWAGSYEAGLNLFDPVKNSFQHFADKTSTLRNHIYYMTQDKKGNIWIATDGGGVSIFNRQHQTFTYLTHSNGHNSISDDRVNYLYFDTRDNLWICTMTGLDKYDIKNNHFTNYTTASGLPNNVIFGIAEDADHNMWISTNRGLSKFTTSTGRFKNFSPADGLQSYEFRPHAVLQSRKGLLYFGGINGFNEFTPANIKDNELDAAPVFTSFEIFNVKIAVAKDDADSSPLKQDIAVAKEIILDYKQSVISFEFASLNYTDPSQKLYSYKMENFDGDWNYVGSKNRATYTNLNPGEYIFHVRAMGKNGEWSSKTATIKLIITPPFWGTWWFKLLLLACAVLAVAGYTRLRMRSIQRQQDKLVEIVNEQTRELAEKNKELEQFVYIASHDLQEPLRTTTGFISLLQKQYQGKLDEKADKYLEFITDATGRMRALIKDLLDYSMIGKSKAFVKVDTGRVLQEVLADLGSAIAETNATITAGQMPEVNGYPTELKQLFQNLIINAIKFRKKDTAPVVTISCKSKGERWQFSIKDNGIGIEKQHLEKIFVIFQRLHTRTDYEGSGIGLAHVKKIVNIHNGEIWVESTFGEGTTFHFTLQK